jgi:hypothetical protein
LTQADAAAVREVALPIKGRVVTDDAIFAVVIRKHVSRAKMLAVLRESAAVLRWHRGLSSMSGSICCAAKSPLADVCLCYLLFADTG